MPDNYNEPILAEDSIGDFLLKLSEKVYNMRRGTPEYAAFRQQRGAWNDTLKGLGGDLLEQYDNLIMPAFLDYQETLENYLITQGILRTIEHRAEDVDPAGLEILGLDAVAAGLEAACGEFVGHLTEETAEQCAAYLRLRREMIDAGRGLCWQCGVEFAEGLLAREGI